MVAPQVPGPLTTLCRGDVPFLTETVCWLSDGEAIARLLVVGVVVALVEVSVLVGLTLVVRLVIGYRQRQRMRRFVAKWSGTSLGEMAGYVEFHLNLCAVFGAATPAAIDPSGKICGFQMRVERASGGYGYADCAHRGKWLWEYKARGSDLDAAFCQALDYRRSLSDPPLTIVTDFYTFRVYIRFLGDMTRMHQFTLDDLARGGRALAILRAVFLDPNQLRSRRGWRRVLPWNRFGGRNGPPPTGLSSARARDTRRGRARGAVAAMPFKEVGS